MSSASQEFFVVSGVWTQGALRVATCDPLVETDIVGEFKGEVLEPRIRCFSVRGGRREDDYVETGLPPLTLVSAQCVGVFESAGLTGWSTYEVELRKRRGWPRKEYAGLRIVGRCGPIDNARSQLMLRISPYSGLRSDVYLGLYFEEGTWDGSDLFVSSGSSAHLFASKRAKAAAARGGLKGIEFQPIERVERLPGELARTARKSG